MATSRPRPVCSVVFDMPVIDHMAKVVLMAYATFIGDNTMRTRPAATTIARGLGVSGRTVQRALRRLVDAGQMEVVEERSGRPTIYRILPPTPDTGVTPVTRDTPDTGVRGGVTPVSGGGDTGVTRRARKNHEEQSFQRCSSGSSEVSRAREGVGQPAPLGATRAARPEPSPAPEPEKWTDDDEDAARARLAEQRRALGVSDADVEEATYRVLGPSCAECGSRGDACRCGWPEPEPEETPQADDWQGQHDPHGDGQPVVDGPTYTGGPNPDTEGHLL